MAGGFQNPHRPPQHWSDLLVGDAQRSGVTGLAGERGLGGALGEQNHTTIIKYRYTPSVTRLLIAGFLTTNLTGCAIKTAADGGSNPDTANQTDPISDTGTQLDDTGLSEEAAWWRLSARLLLVQGIPQPKDSQLTLTLVSNKLKPICSEVFTLSELTAEKPPDETLYTWWTLTLGKGDGGCIGNALPTDTLQLGVGTMHPDILPGISSDEDIADPSALNGAYASLDDGKTLLVFGAAGLVESWSSGGVPAEASPLTDGIWRIEPVYTFEYVK